jgi:hypothetical protein
MLFPCSAWNNYSLLYIKLFVFFLCASDGISYRIYDSVCCTVLNTVLSSAFICTVPPRRCGQVLVFSHRPKCCIVLVMILLV